MVLGSNKLRPLLDNYQTILPLIAYGNFSYEQKNSDNTNSFREIFQHFFNKNDFNEIIILRDKDELPQGLRENNSVAAHPFQNFLEGLSERFGVPCPSLSISEGGELSGCCWYLLKERKAHIELKIPYNALSTETVKAVIAHEFFHYLQHRSNLSLHPHVAEYLADGFAAAETSEKAVIGFYSYFRSDPISHELNRVPSDSHPSLNQREEFLTASYRKGQSAENFWQEAVRASRITSGLGVRMYG